MPVEELTLKMASLANVLDWLTQPQGPHLVDRTSTKDPLTALAILITPEALYDPDSPMMELGLVYKAPYIRPPPGVRLTSTSSLPLKPRRATELLAPKSSSYKSRRVVR